SEKSTSLFAATTVISLALLIKLPSAIVGAPLLFFVWQKWRWNFVKQPWLWHAHQIAGKFYPHHFFGAGGIRIENFSWYWGVLQVTATSSLTPILAIIAFIGLFVAPR